MRGSDDSVKGVVLYVQNTFETKTHFTDCVVAHEHTPTTRLPANIHNSRSDVEFNPETVFGPELNKNPRPCNSAPIYTPLPLTMHIDIHATPQHNTHNTRAMSLPCPPAPVKAKTPRSLQRAMTPTHPRKLKFNDPAGMSSPPPPRPTPDSQGFDKAAGGGNSHVFTWMVCPDAPQQPKRSKSCLTSPR